MGLMHYPEEDPMPARKTLILMLVLGAAALSGCGPLVVGGAGVIIADAVVEDQQGGDGLF